MSSTLASHNYGRLGNQIFRNLAVSLIAEKHDLHVTYAHYDKISELGIPLFSGNRQYETTLCLNDDNYFSIYNNDKLDHNVDGNAFFFQTKDISNMIFKYLQSIQDQIKNKNPFCERYNSSNDLYVHIRLTDTSQYNPGIDYYLTTIASIEFDTLYISSDDPEHLIIKQIQERYKDSILLEYDEVKTFQFASTCKHIVLSHGSFSAIIGYLSFFSTVHYPDYEPGRAWFGDIFSIEGWIKHSLGNKSIT